MDVVLSVNADWMQMIVKGKEKKRKRRLTGCNSWWWTWMVVGCGGGMCEFELCDLEKI